jgi:hypothetical protein
MLTANGCLLLGSFEAAIGRLLDDALVVALLNGLRIDGSALMDGLMVVVVSALLMFETVAFSSFCASCVLLNNTAGFVISLFSCNVICPIPDKRRTGEVMNSQSAAILLSLCEEWLKESDVRRAHEKCFVQRLVRIRYRVGL